LPTTGVAGHGRSITTSHRPLQYYFAHTDGNQRENAGIGTPQEG
jgi:hypothetical protein